MHKMMQLKTVRYVLGYLIPLLRFILFYLLSVCSKCSLLLTLLPIGIPEKN